MSLEPGTTLGPYQVTAKIGEGGMGEVYRARDTKLDRDVALKVLPQAFTDDPDRLARFEREAKVLASLNHPNIGGIHGLEESEGVRALVLEYIEGPTLADRIAQGPIPVEEALPIAKQIAEALEAAHEAGVIHRDLKPANIKVRDDGTVKVLDFGLAKALAGDLPGADLSQSPTVTATVTGTRDGVILGTAAYMSPEQARGKLLDRRTDIWSFGCVLYEILTGHAAFLGETLSDTIAKILERDPDWQALPTSTPVLVRSLLRRCLAKDPKGRLRDIGDARLEIGEAVAAPAGTMAAMLDEPRAEGRWRTVPWVAGILVALIAGLAVGNLTRSTPAVTVPVTRFPIALPPDQSTTGHHLIAFSPDGTQLAYVANDQLYIRAMDQLESAPVPGTEGALEPFFSPDGQSVGFWAEGQLKRVALTGGAPVTIGETREEPFAPRWGADNDILFGALGGVWQVPASGGTPEVVISPGPGEDGLGNPQALPGGEWVLFSVVPGGQVAIESLRTGERDVLVENAEGATYVPTGHLVFVRDGTLLAQPFDVERRIVAPGPVSLGEAVRTGTTPQFTLSDSGSLAYLTGGEEAAATRSLVWVDREGREEVIPAEPRDYASVQLSPDGQRVVTSIAEGGNPDLMVYDLARETPSLFTFDPGNDGFPIWTLDGARIVWSSNRTTGARFDVVWKAADGTGQVDHLTTGANPQSPYSWSADGRTLVMIEQRSETGIDIGLLSLDSEETIDWVVDGPGDEGWPDVSPDGRWMAYTSTESGQTEVFVTPFPNVADGRWKVSQDGGLIPQWGPDSRELFFQTGDGTIMVAVNETVSAFTGTPVPLFDRPYWFPGGPYSQRSFDISPDGQRLLVIREGAGNNVQVEPPEIKIVLNWFEELTERVPTN
jgi:serine/threonine-protein kinase